MPLILYFIYPPELKDTREIQAHIAKELKELGSMSFAEKVMLGVIYFISSFVGYRSVYRP